MTHIVNKATKKALKEALANGERVYADDPSIFSPKPMYLNDLLPGQTIVCTDHPKRSWFAEVKNVDGTIKVS